MTENVKETVNGDKHEICNCKIEFGRVVSQQDSRKMIDGMYNIEFKRLSQERIKIEILSKTLLDVNRMFLGSPH